jgi:hypothetical protein
MGSKAFGLPGLCRGLILSLPLISADFGATREQDQDGNWPITKITEYPHYDSVSATA